jgi:putative FmdB family regulatory protein
MFATMPTYDYKCESCGHRFDAWQKITDDPLAECPVCGGPVHRVLYPVGVLFKGSGFYINDSRASANGKSGADSASEAPTAEGKPAETKTESKSEAKADAKSEAKPASVPAEAKPGKAPATTASE